MQKQKRCYNHLQISKKLMPSISKDINQQKRRIRTLEKISPLIFLLLIYLIGSNLSIKARPIKKTITTEEILDIIRDKDSHNCFITKINIIPKKEE